MTQSTVARKTYIFRATPQSSNLWYCPFLIYKGKFGRVEAWNPNIRSSDINIKPEQGTFWVYPYVSGSQAATFGFVVSDVTINGGSVFLNGKFVIDAEMSGNQNGLTIYFVEDPGENAIINIIIKSSRTWIPWIQYKDRPELPYDPYRGLIDWDGLPCDSISLSQNINMELQELQSWSGILPTTIVGLLSSIAINGMFSNDNLKGRGIVSIIKNDTPDGSLLYDDSGRLLNSAPQEVLKYKYETSWYREFLEAAEVFGTLGNPSIINQAQCVTGEYFLLKYHKLYINPFDTSYNDSKYQFINLRSYAVFPYLIYADYANFFPRIKPWPRFKGGSIINTSLNYRNAFFNLKNSSPHIPFMIDRLRYLSQLSPSSIESGIEQAPYEFKNGILDEFNYLNSRIKSNKLIILDGVKLQETYKSSSYLQKDYGIYEYDILNEGISDDNIEDGEIMRLNYKIKNSLINEYGAGVLKSNEIYSLNLFKNVKIKVIIEQNSNKNFNKFNPEKKYTICGKLIDSRWMLANRGIMQKSDGSQDMSKDTDIELNEKSNLFTELKSYVQNSSLLGESELWKYIGLSQKTINYIIYDSTCVENIDKICLYLVVRGIDENQQEELIFKDKNSDYIIVENSTNEAPDNTILSGCKIFQWDFDKGEKIPIISLCGKSALYDFLEPIKVFIYFKSEDSDVGYYEVSRKIITPDKNVFYFNTYEDFVCPLIQKIKEQDDSSQYNLPEDNAQTEDETTEFEFNPPECGNLNQIKIITNGVEHTVNSPKYTFNILNKSDGNFPFSNHDYRFQIVYLGNVLPYKPLTSDPYSPNTLEYGWVPVVKGNKFVGIKLTKKWDGKTQFYLRCNKIGGTFKERNSPIKETNGLKIRLELNNNNPPMNLYLNRDNKSEIYNIECVGINRMSTYSDWYTEIIPGRGLRVRTGHGISFQPFVTDNRVDMFANQISGAFNFPWAYFDSYNENSRTLAIEKVEQNNFTTLSHGAEIEFRTNINDKGTLSVFTLTTYPKSKETQIRIFSLYDENFDTAYVLYNNDANRIMIKRGEADWYDERGPTTNSKEIGDDFDFFIDDLASYAKKEYTVVLGGAKFDNEITQDITNIGTMNLKAFDKNGNIISETINNCGSKATFMQSISSSSHIVAVKIKAKIPKQGIAYAKIKYSTSQEKNTFIDYGYCYSKKRFNAYGEQTFITPTIFQINDGNNEISCPAIQNPNVIRVEFIIPNYVFTKESFEQYCSILKSSSLEITEFGYVDDSKVPRALNIVASLSDSNVLNLFYCSEYIYTADGQQIIKSELNGLNLTQLIQSNNGGDSWHYPGMLESNNQIKLSDSALKESLNKEKDILKESGYNDQQITALCQDSRSWDSSMIISAMKSPMIIYNNGDDSVSLFGLMQSSDSFDLTSWNINNSTIDMFFLPNVMENTNGSSVMLPRSSKDLENNEKSSKKLIDAGIKDQTVGATIINTKEQLVFYIKNDVLYAKISRSNGDSWESTPITFFGSGSTFEGICNIFLVRDDANSSTYIFGLKKIADIGEYQLYFWKLDDASLQDILNIGESTNSLEGIQEEINKQPKILVVGNPNDLSPSETGGTYIKTIIGNAKENNNGTYVILKPYLRPGSEEDLIWDENNPPKMTYSLDENITIPHTAHGYVDLSGNIRIFYINRDNKIESKVSENCGDTWRIDLSV